MKIALTKKNDGKEILVDVDSILLIEPDSDGVSTHIVLGADFVRVVIESYEAIKAIIGSIDPVK